MSFSSWLRCLKSRFELSHIKPAWNRRRRGGELQRRPRLEVLEDRLAPTVVTWTGNGGDFNWDTATNWSTVVTTPSSADDVQINTTGITITHSSAIADSINSLTSQAAIVLSGGSLSIAAGSSINN